MKLLTGPSQTVELQMVAMVDVVFILLSFFVLASEFRATERDYCLGYSSAGLSPGAHREDFPKSLVIRLTPEGAAAQITVGQAKLGPDQFGAITTKLAEVNMPDLPVVIVADVNLSVDQVAKALDAALMSPMKKVSVSGQAGRKQ